MAEPAGPGSAGPEPSGATEAPGPPVPSGAQGPDGGRRELTAVVLAVALGGGLGVLATARTWSTVTVRRLAPLASVHHDVTGRTLQPAVTGLAVVALAGVLALLATRGLVRRAVGGVLVLTGLGMVGWALAALAAVSDAEGRTLVADARSGLDLGAAAGIDVVVHPAWIAVAALGGVLVVLSGVVTVLRGGRWRAMSARYESPTGRDSLTGRDSPTGYVSPAPPGPVQTPAVARAVTSDLDPDAAEVARARAAVALWQQLDRGEDPTDIEEDPGRPPPR